MPRSLPPVVPLAGALLLAGFCFQSSGATTLSPSASEIAAAVPDGGGGMIVVSSAERAGGAYADIYVQKVNAAGVPQWTTLGAVLCTTAEESRRPVLASDGAGGVILAWLDFRGPSSGAVYAQRVGSSGVALWAAGGVQLCTTAGPSPTGPPLDIVTDASGGAIVAWRDYRSDTGDIYAQRVDAGGAAQWAAGGIGVSVTVGEQRFPELVTDGAGGAIVYWGDTRNGNADIYAQRIDSSGTPQWTVNGVPVCTAIGAQSRRQLLADGAGGTFLVWTDARSDAGDIYAQRVNSSGVPQWTADGVPVCGAAGEQTFADLAPDGAGGVVVAWQDRRSGADYDIYAQRLNGSGVAQWTATGVGLCSSAGDQSGPVIETDGANGAIVTWVNSSGMRRLYAQRVNSSGVPQWTANGVTVCPGRIYEQLDPVMVSDLAGGVLVAWIDWGIGEQEVYGQRLSGAGTLAWGAAGVGLILDPGVQRLPVGVPDGSGGVILAWIERQAGQEYDIYARRIAPGGTFAWPKVAVCTASGDQLWPVVTSDGDGGAIIAWADLRTGLDMGVYAQRLNASGVPQWAGDGVALVAGPGVRLGVGIVSDGAGGAIACWEDFRSGTSFDLYAQRVDAAGSPQWTPNGVAICTAAGNQRLSGDPGSVHVVSDGSGGAYLAWVDYRNGNSDIYAQRIGPGGASLWTANGEVVCTATGSQQSQVVALDTFTSGLFVVWEDYRSGTSYDVYAQRLTPTGSVWWTPGGVAVESGTAGGYNPRVVADGLGGAIFAWYDYRGSDANVYAQRMSSVGGAMWTLNGVTVCGAAGDQRKPEIIPDANNGAIMVWEDRRGAGNDGLDLYAQRLNSQGALLWPADGAVVCNAVNSQAVPALIRDGAGGAIVAWQDRRDGVSDYIFNQRLNSAGSTLWTANGVTSVPPDMTGGTPLSLGSVRPNPSRGPLTIAFTLPGHGPASIQLLDVTGREVASRHLGDLAAGSHVVSWEHGATLAPGVYVVLLRQGPQTQTRKVCVLK